MHWLWEALQMKQAFAFMSQHRAEFVDPIHLLDAMLHQSESCALESSTSARASETFFAISTRQIGHTYLLDSPELVAQRRVQGR